MPSPTLDQDPSPPPSFEATEPRRISKDPDFEERPLRWFLRELLGRADAPLQLWVLRSGLLVSIGVTVWGWSGMGWWSLALGAVLVALSLASAFGLGRWLSTYSYFRAARDRGTARTLVGRHRYELHFDGPLPDDDALARTRARIEVALTWLREQAAGYGHHLEFECVGIESELGELSPRIDDRDRLDRGQVAALGKRLHARSGDRDLAFVIVFTREGGYRACASQTSGDIEEPDQLEYCVCPLDESWPCTIAHELLHLFGAQDLYFPDPITTAQDEHQASTLHLTLGHGYRRFGSWSFTRSIMRMSAHPHAIVDPLNAYAVGWRGWLSE